MRQNHGRGENGRWQRECVCVRGEGGKRERRRQQESKGSKMEKMMMSYSGCLPAQEGGEKGKRWAGDGCSGGTDGRMDSPTTQNSPVERMGWG